MQQCRSTNACLPLTVFFVIRNVFAIEENS